MFWLCAFHLFPKIHRNARTMRRIDMVENAQKCFYSISVGWAAGAIVFEINGPWMTDTSVTDIAPNIWGLQNKLLIDSFIWHRRSPVHGARGAFTRTHQFVRASAENTLITPTTHSQPALAADNRKNARSVFLINERNFIVIDNTATDVFRSDKNSECMYYFNLFCFKMIAACFV